MAEWKQYRKATVTELRPYHEGEELPPGVSIADEDKKGGSPKVGDMIARNPAKPTDMWLVSRAFFEENYRPI